MIHRDLLVHLGNAQNVKEIFQNGPECTFLARRGVIRLCGVLHLGRIFRSVFRRGLGGVRSSALCFGFRQRPARFDEKRFCLCLLRLTGLFGFVFQFIQERFHRLLFACDEYFDSASGRFNPHRMRFAVGIEARLLADVIVDVVSSGNTLRANNLEAVEEIAKISSRLVVNQAALKLKRPLIQPVIDAFARAVKRDA